MAKRSELTLQFIPFTEIQTLSSYKRVKYLLEVIAENRIVLLQGKLNSEEEADLIEETMKKIGGSRKSRFKGIELAVFSPKPKNLPLMQAARENIAKMLVGNRDVFTVIGPATIVREIKKDPTKIELLLRK